MREYIDDILFGMRLHEIKGRVFEMNGDKSRGENGVNVITGEV